MLLESERESVRTNSVTEDITEAMGTPVNPAVRSPRDIPTPAPHLPLRKSSAQWQHAHRSTPKPLFAAAQHQLRGFNPPAVEALPHMDSVNASSEHAFAGKDVRRPSKLPLGVQELGHGQQQQDGISEQSHSGHNAGLRHPSLPQLTAKTRSGSKSNGLRSKSLGDGLRNLRYRMSKRHRALQDGDTDASESGPHRPSLDTSDGNRASFRSGLTSNSSTLNASSVHTQSSIVTGNSSQSDFVKVHPNWPLTEDLTGDLVVSESVGTHVDAFDETQQSTEDRRKQSTQSDSYEAPVSHQTLQHEVSSRPNPIHRRSHSASVVLTLNPAVEPGRTLQQRTDTRSAGDRQSHLNPISFAPKAYLEGAVPRDRYGFKKASHYTTIAQYDAWDTHYAKYLERRRKKWFALMRSYGLNTDRPFRFPPKSDKIKRYVRKGIPPSLRGAAWFWYAGGPGRLAKEPGLYWAMLEQVEEGRLSDNDREHIERDLNRTFPDNLRFKPDPTATLDAQAGAGGGRKRGSVEVETPIVHALRRVLQAFAVHNPNIGYCQSLNFIAGLLLLFLDEDEEKAFVLLNIVTSVHLPGTHGIALEGANIDIAVLMSCVKEQLNPIWLKLDDKGGGGLTGESSAQALRLPTVSLATTAWFMSLFVGTLPIESVLRVWDCLFFEGSKTLFRIALAIFKAGERQILAVNDSMEIFQVVQTIPRSMLDVNALMEVCFRRRGGFGGVSQGQIEAKREERRREVRAGVVALEVTGSKDWKGRWRSKTKV